jgi:uncharacterized repeat protein (TIGR03803 family)
VSREDDEEINMNKFNWGMRACGVFLLLAATAIVLPAQTFTTLHSFDQTDGQLLSSGLLQGTDGNFYGTTEGGGGNLDGTVFKITPDGTLTTLYNFCSHSHCTDGAGPNASLVQGTDGKLYGTTYFGGSHSGPNFDCYEQGCGTVFSVTAGGNLTTLYRFDYTDGDNPWAGLVEGTDGQFYGTTQYGRSNDAGTVFKITSRGALTTLYHFCSQSDCTDGYKPLAALVQGTDGSFYGTTYNGGASGCPGGCGTVFRITSSGSLTTLHSFDGTDGFAPVAALVQATNSDFYGVASRGGANAYGTVFKITPSGTLTTLYSFDGTHGNTPFAGLIEGTDGKFYGTTDGGGIKGSCFSFGCGTIFRITPDGRLTTLYTFCSQADSTNCTDGSDPMAGLVQGTDGKLYGTTFGGGTSYSCYPYHGCGTVFSLSVGLGPFVETQPTSGVVGKPVKILGTNLTGATSVAFSGTAATFMVKSKSEIIATVPLGATTGKVKVTSPRGTLSSNVPFRVK